MVRQNYRRSDRDDQTSNGSSRPVSGMHHHHHNGSISPFVVKSHEDLKDVRGTGGYDSLRHFDMTAAAYGGFKPTANPLPPTLLDTYLQMMRASGGDFMPPGMLGNRHASVLDLTRGGHGSPHRMDDDDGRASDNFTDDENTDNEKQTSGRSSNGPLENRSPISDDVDNKWSVK